MPEQSKFLDNESIFTDHPRVSVIKPLVMGYMCKCFPLAGFPSLVYCLQVRLGAYRREEHLKGALMEETLALSANMVYQGQTVQLIWQIRKFKKIVTCSDTQHNDTKHKGLIYDTLYNETNHNGIECSYAERRFLLLC